jgi:hypothetical protein
MPWTETQRAAHYAYYRRRALDLLQQLEVPHPQPADLEQIIQVARCLTRTCPFSALNHFYQTIIHQATAAVNRTIAAQRESELLDQSSAG